MRKGAFAILDCLGFKGIWRNKNVDPEQLIRYLSTARGDSEGHGKIGQLIKHLYGDRVQIYIAFVSDSVVISVQFHEKLSPHKHEEGYLVSTAVSICCEVQRRFIRGPTPLALRGCVAMGDHIVVDNFFAGPAVDEAASLAEVSQGAFIWLTPEAEESQRQYLEIRAQSIAAEGLSPEQKVASVDAMMKSLLVPAFGLDKAGARWAMASFEQKFAASAQMEKIFTAMSETVVGVVNGYQMPLKAGGALRVSVVNPFMSRLQMNWHKEVSDMYGLFLASFNSSSVDVLMKRQYTQAFLDVARSAALDVSVRRNLALVGPLAEIEKLMPSSVQPT